MVGLCLCGTHCVRGYFVPAQVPGVTGVLRGPGAVMRQPCTRAYWFRKRYRFAGGPGFYLVQIFGKASMRVPFFWRRSGLDRVFSKPERFSELGRPVHRQTFCAIRRKREPV